MSNIEGQTNKFPIMKVLERNPLMVSALSKAIEQPTNTGASTIRDTETAIIASLGEFQQFSRTIQQELLNYESFFQIFPDMNIDRAIVTGSLLAPNNMFREDLVFSIENELVPPVLAGRIIQIANEDIERKYGFVHDLRKIVDNAMFYRGSHVKLVLPEAAIDYLINNRGGLRMEGADIRSFFSQKENQFRLGLLSNPVKNRDGTKALRMESYEDRVKNYSPTLTTDNRWDHYPEMKGLVDKGIISFTDDFSQIKLPFYSKIFDREHVRDLVSAQRQTVNRLRTENYSQLSTNRNVGDINAGTAPANNIQVEASKSGPIPEGTINSEQLRAAIFKAAPTEQRIFQRIPRLNNLSRHSIGPCLCIDAPSEAFIPICYPGQPDKHAGYIGLYDPTSGYFLTVESQREVLNNFTSSAFTTSANTTTGGPNTAGGLGASITEKAKQNLVSTDRSTPLRFHPQIFGSLITEDMLDRVNGSGAGFELEAEMNNSLAYVMMARANAGRQTMAIYLPVDFVSYFAFDHNANGTGRSLLAGVQNLLSLRAAALYSRVANQIRNAISITDVNVTLDDRDHQPHRTLMKVVDLVTQSRSQFFPWGLNTASDIWAWWNRAGYQLNIEGHPALPKTKVEYSHRAHDHHAPDIADDSYLADMVGHHFGVTPELKDAGKGADFATSITNNRILFASRSLAHQQKLNPQITAHVRRILFNDSEIFAKIRATIKESWEETKLKMDDHSRSFYENIEEDEAIDSYMRTVIDSMKVILPPPEVTTIQNQIEAFKEFSEAVDFAVEQVLADQTLMAQMFGEDAEATANMVAMSVAQIKRDWMMKNGFLEELFDMVSVDQENKPKSKLLTKSSEFSLSFMRNLHMVLQDYLTKAAAAKEDLGILTGRIPPAETAPTEGEGGSSETKPPEA